MVCRTDGPLPWTLRCAGACLSSDLVMISWGGGRSAAPCACLARALWVSSLCFLLHAVRPAGGAPWTIRTSIFSSLTQMIMNNYKASKNSCGKLQEKYSIVSLKVFIFLTQLLCANRAIHTTWFQSVLHSSPLDASYKQKCNLPYKHCLPCTYLSTLHEVAHLNISMTQKHSCYFDEESEV